MISDSSEISTPAPTDAPADAQGTPTAGRTVKQFDPDDQPRERAVRHGIGVLPTADLWAIVLRTGLPGKPITELARDLMRANSNNLHSLERRSRKELMAMPGIGLTKAVQIEAVMELIRRYAAEQAEADVLIRDSRDIYNLMRPAIGNLPHEEIWALFLNRRLSVVRRFRIGEGGQAGVVFDVRKMLKEALLENASAIALCHNHPSGNLKPSPQDDAVTRTCKAACATMDIRLVDHVIVSASGFYSYSDEGRLPS